MDVSIFSGGYDEPSWMLLVDGENAIGWDIAGRGNAENSVRYVVKCQRISDLYLLARERSELCEKVIRICSNIFLNSFMSNHINGIVS